MVKINNKRRMFLKNSSLILSSIIFSSLIKLKNLNAKNNRKPKIVIVGYGVGGATCLNYLLEFSKNFDISVVEKSEKIQTCPMSNLVIADILPYSYISHDFNYKRFKNIKFINSSVKKIDPIAKKIENER